MSLHAPTLETTLTGATATVRQLLAGGRPADRGGALRGLAARGSRLRQSLHRFGTLQGEHRALAAQAAAAEAAPQASARLARFEAEWWGTWRHAARLAAALIALERLLGAGSATAWAAGVQTLAISSGERPDAALVRSTIEQLSSRPEALVAGAAWSGSTALMETLPVVLALATVLLERRGVAT